MGLLKKLRPKMLAIDMMAMAVNTMPPQMAKKFANILDDLARRASGLRCFVDDEFGHGHS